MVEFAAMDHPTGWIIGPGDHLLLFLISHCTQLQLRSRNSASFNEKVGHGHIFCLLLPSYHMNGQLGWVVSPTDVFHEVSSLLDFSAYASPHFWLCMQPGLNQQREISLHGR